MEEKKDKGNFLKALWRSNVFRISSIVLFVVLTINLLYQNCSKVNWDDDDDSTSINDLIGTMDTSGEARFLKFLNDADNKATELSYVANSDPEILALATEIRKLVDEIQDLIKTYPYHHNLVLDVRDYLLYQLSNAGDVLVLLDVDKRIADLDAKITTLKSELDTKLSRTEFTSFKNDINGRVQLVENSVEALEGLISGLESQLGMVSDRVDLLQSTTEVALTSLENTIQDLKNSFGADIADLKAANEALLEKINKQSELFDKLSDEQQLVTDLQDKMCQYDQSGNVIGTACDGSDPDIWEKPASQMGCCLTLANLNCESMFPAGSSAVNQCNIMVMSLKMHEQQIVNINAVNEAQSKILEGLFADVKTLNVNLSALTNTVADFGQSTLDISDAIWDAISSIHERLTIEEFKSARSEMVAGINELNDLYLAWIARRTVDVKKEFCLTRAKMAFDVNDYEVARQNHEFCHDRLSILNEAKQITHLAKAYTQAVLSSNVDQTCNATINSAGGILAKDVSSSQIKNQNVQTEIIKECDSGFIYAKALLMRIVTYQKNLGPDFRTVEYFKTKSESVQRLYLGGTYAQISTNANAISSFEDIVPWSEKNKNTYYGIVERVFKKNYIEHALRVNGDFPKDPNSLPKPNNLVYLSNSLTRKDILDSSGSKKNALINLEFELTPQGNPTNAPCGYKVVGRNSLNKNGKDLFCLPGDHKTKCPVDDVVLLKSSDGKHYAYHIYYTRHAGATERFEAYWKTSAGNHLPVNVGEPKDGEFRQCWYAYNRRFDRFGLPGIQMQGRLVLRTSMPYGSTHNLPQCRKFYLSCHSMKTLEWVAPEDRKAEIHKYLSGLDKTKLEQACKETGAAYEDGERSLTENERKSLVVYPALYNDLENAGALTILKKGYQFYDEDVSTPFTKLVTSIDDAASINTSQLIEDYWMYQDTAIKYAGLNLSKNNPFYLSNIKTKNMTANDVPAFTTAQIENSSNIFLRNVFRIDDYVTLQNTNEAATINDSLNVQQCYDPVVQ